MCWASRRERHWCGASRRRSSWVSWAPSPAPTRDHCWAVGVPGPNATMPAGDSTVIVATTNGGATWKAQRVVGGYTPELSGVACPTAKDCMAVGSNGLSSGVAVVTQDGGAYWASATTPTGAIAVESVVCEGLAECTALVSNGTAVWSSRTTDFGQTWTQMGNLPASFVTDGALSVPARRGLPGPRVHAHQRGTRAGGAGGQLRRGPDLEHGLGARRDRRAAGGGVPDDIALSGLGVHLHHGQRRGRRPGRDAAQRGRRRRRGPPPRRRRSTMPTAWPARRPDSAYWWAPTGRATRRSPRVRWPRAPTGAPTSPSPSSAYAPITLTAVDCPSRAACVAVGGDVVARDHPGPAPRCRTRTRPPPEHADPRDRIGPGAAASSVTCAVSRDPSQAGSLVRGDRPP